MTVSLATQAEKLAQKAEAFPAFGGLNLLNIKRQISHLVSLIGRDGIFDEYTRHDISHVDGCLAILDWIIPDQTKKIMSPADWLLTVLSIYFHDLGMLVTRREYENRDKSGFPDYRDSVLFCGDRGEDYKQKLQKLPPENMDRFLYQEFVRSKHGERIRNWIMGKSPEHLGVTHAAMNAVNDLLQHIDAQFRRDLALVCESHHLEDLYDFTKYRVSQAYGGDAETANIYYGAILLRAVDLLHITSDRTPSIVFRVINPTDPVSQLEWAKQNGVKRVRPKIGTNADGNADENAPRDTIEIFAYFTNEEGFFGLTSYLNYANAEINKCYNWTKTANKTRGSHHEFPWRRIDDTQVEAQGFMPKTFEFGIDQPKILDLLTGHTLYNDTRVVLRELVQNSLDAVRLQLVEDNKNSISGQQPKVTVHWNSKEGVLSVQDNGTGMTQDTIEKHFLKVGASLYQDPEFRRKFPNFSAISRFGIGILSTFMVADTVDICTCHPDDVEARHLSLRSVHGRYLIRLLDKKTDSSALSLMPHGTLVRLKIRPSAKMPDVIEAAKRWFLLPFTKILVQVDDGAQIVVGFNSPKEALKSILESVGISVEDKAATKDRSYISIVEKEVDGATLAFAVRWEPYYQEWSFVKLASEPTHGPDFGTCIEGVRVLFESPGFVSKHIPAIVNSRGLSSPKTTVIRLGFEDSPEFEAMMRKIYSIYCDHIKCEIQELYKKRNFSLSWATRESRYLITLLLGTEESTFLGAEKYAEASRNDILNEEIKKLPSLLVEANGTRTTVSPADLSRENSFWTIDCDLIDAAERMMREIRSDVSLANVVESLKVPNVRLPKEPVLCSFTNDFIDKMVTTDKEVDCIHAYLDQRRVDLRWVAKSNPARWVLLDMAEPVRRRLPAGIEYAAFVERGNVTKSGLAGYAGVITNRMIFVFDANPISKYLLVLHERFHTVGEVKDAITIVFSIITHLVLGGSRIPRDIQELQEFILRRAYDIGGHGAQRMMVGRIEGYKQELMDVIAKSNWNYFNPSLWHRSFED